jgi:hypothetical protein
MIKRYTRYVGRCLLLLAALQVQLGLAAPPTKEGLNAATMAFRLCSCRGCTMVATRFLLYHVVAYLSIFIYTRRLKLISSLVL